MVPKPTYPSLLMLDEWPRNPELDCTQVRMQMRETFWARVAALLPPMLHAGLPLLSHVG